MPSGQPSRSQVSSLATTSSRRRSPLRALLRFIGLLLFLISAAYLAHAVWNAVQYVQTPPGYANFGLIPSMAALPGFGLSRDTELGIGLVMLVLFIASLTLLLATRPRHVGTSRSAPAGAIEAALPAGSPPPDGPSQGPTAPAAPAERHGLPLLPHMLIPTLPPEEAALLVPPADTPDSSGSDGSSDSSDGRL